MTCEFAPFLISITTLIPSLSDSSLKSEIPSIFLSLTRSAMLSTSFALFTRYGSSVTMIRSRSFRVSISVIATMPTMPRPVVYAALTPESPVIAAAVGKSGALISAISSSTVASGLSITWIIPSTVSPRLCGGMLVAMPTAIPVEPLIRRFGRSAGRTEGSFKESS